MSAKVEPKKKPSWFWPVIFVVALGLVLYVSGAQQVEGPGDTTLIKSPDDYQNTLKQANAILAEELVKDGKPLTGEDTKKLRDAATMYERLNVYNPTKMGPYFASGRVHLMLGENQVAAERFQQAILNSLQPSNDPAPQVAQLRADSQFYLATCLENQNDFVDALPPINEALKAFPDRSDYLYVRARALIQMKKLPEARADLEQSLKLKPGDEKASSLLKFVTG